MSPTPPSRRAARPTRAHRPGWTGPTTTTPCAVVAPDGEQITRFSITHDAAGLRTPGPAAAGGRRGRGRDRTPRRPGRRRAAPGRADRLRHPTRAAQEPAVAATARPATRTTGSTPTCWPTSCAPTGAGCARCWSTPPATTALRQPVPGPQRPGRPPGRGGQPAARAPADRVSRRGRAVRRHRLRHQPAVPGTLPHPRRAPTGSRPSGWPPGCPRSATAAAPRPTPCTPACATPRPAPPARPATPPPPSPPRSWPCCAPSPPRSTPWPPRSPSNSTCTPTSRSSPACPGSGSVRAARLLAEIGDARGRFPTADSLACLAGVAPSTRQSGKVEVVCLPLGRGQTTPRRRLRLRRRQPPRQPLGRRPLPPRPRPRPRPPPRRAHPGPRLGRHHLGLLDHQHPLRPRPPPRAPTHPQPRSTEGGLTQGNSPHSLAALGRRFARAL